MKSVVVDISGIKVDDFLIPVFNIAVQNAIQTSLLLVKDSWQRQAQAKLHATRSDYLIGLDFNSLHYPYHDDPFTGAVVLQGKFPNMLEEGFAPYDIKAVMAKSNKVVHKANGGWSITIPMRHSTPNSFMYGQPMPIDIYAQAKKLPNRASLTVTGGIKTSWTGYVHKANINDGLTRIIKDYGKTKQSTYMTFRKITDKSDPKSWWHPGFGGVHIADSLEHIAETSFKRALSANLAQMNK